MDFDAFGAMVLQTRPYASGDDLGERILDAALVQFSILGVRRSSIDDVANRADVGRVTIFRRFGSKDGLVSALVLREAQTIMEHADAEVDHLDELEETLVEGFRVTLLRARKHPFLHGMLRAEPDVLRRMLTTEGGPAIAVVAAMLTRYLRDFDVPDADQAAEVMARLGISILLLPEASFELDTDEHIRAFARRFLVPIATGGSVL
jgi:AcrR family transcriptional regulator